MAKEFMLYIRNEGDAKAALTQGEYLAFIKQCEVYIGQLSEKKPDCCSALDKRRLHS